MKDINLLLGFRVENFRSVRSEQSLRLTRTARDAIEGFLEPDVVPAIAIFGANASGKSNFLRALSTMFRMIRTSATRPDEPLPFSPYLLTRTPQAETMFEVATRFNGIRYDYGFTYNNESITGEWLRSWPKGRQRTLFDRKGDDDGWYFGDSLSGGNLSLARATRSDALLLSTAGILRHEILSPLYEQFASLLHNTGTNDLPQTLQQTLQSLATKSDRQLAITKLLAHADLGVGSIVVEEDKLSEEVREQTRKLYEALMPNMSADELSERLDRATLSPQLHHASADGMIGLPFGWESVGTQNFLALLGPILDRLEAGGVLIVDEIDTSLHPRLVSELVRLFQSPLTNRRQAQLILSTHDVTVMMNAGDYGVLERDQLWFVEKDANGTSTVYPLSDFSPRKSEVFSRSYLNGRYGAVPAIDNHSFSNLWND